MADLDELIRVRIEADLALDKTKTAERQFDQSMANIKSSAGKAEEAVTQAGHKMSAGLNSSRAGQMELMHIVRGSIDQYAAGAHASQILSQHVAMLGEAAQLSSGAFGAFGAFLSGPWGIALTVAVAVLTPLVAKLFEGKENVGDLVEKLQKKYEKTQLNAEADRIWSTTMDALIERLGKVNDKLEQRVRTERELAQLTLAQYQRDAAKAGQNLETVMRAPGSTPEQITAAKVAATAANRILFNETLLQNRELAKSYSTVSGVVKGMADQQTIAFRQMAKLHPELAAQNGVMVGMETAADKLFAAMEKAGSANVSIAGADKQLRQLNDQVKHQTLTADGYIAKVNALTAALDAQAAAASKAGKAHSSGLHGNELTADAAAAVARRAGFQVNSSTRPTWKSQEVPGGPRSQESLYNDPKVNRPGNPVAKPGHGQHEEGAAHWALDIQFGRGVTPQSIAKAFEAEGVKLTKTIVEAGHYHVEGVRAGAAGERASNTAASKAQREAEAAQNKANTQQAAYDSEMAALDQQMVAASKTRATTTDEALQQELGSLDAAGQRKNAEYTAAALAKRITETQAEELIGRNNQVTAAKKDHVMADEARRVADVKAATDNEIANEKVAELSYQASIAKGSKERLAADLALLNAQKDVERAELQRVIDTTAIGSKEHELAVLKQQEVDRARGRAAQDIRQADMSPGQEYAKSLHQTAGQIDDSLQNIAVDGLKSLNDGITDAIMGTKSLGEVFNDVSKQIIAALVKIAVQQLIIKPIADMLFGPGSMGGGGGGGGSTGGGVAGVIGSIISGLFTHRAGGGPVTAGGAYWVGEHGPEPFFPSTNGSIMPNHEAASIMKGGGGNAAPVVSLTVNAPGATAETVSMIRRELAAAAPTLVAAAQRSTIAQLTRQRT